MLLYKQVKREQTERRTERYEKHEQVYDNLYRVHYRK